MYCNNCGREIDASMRFCDYCGRRVEYDSNSQQVDIINEATRIVKSFLMTFADVIKSGNYREFIDQIKASIKSIGREKIYKICIIIVGIVIVLDVGSRFNFTYKSAIRHYYKGEARLNIWEFSKAFPISMWFGDEGSINRSIVGDTFRSQKRRKIKFSVIEEDRLNESYCISLEDYIGKEVDECSLITLRVYMNGYDKTEDLYVMRINGLWYVCPFEIEDMFAGQPFWW